jgi:hypothetical protein
MFIASEASEAGPSSGNFKETQLHLFLSTAAGSVEERLSSLPPEQEVRIRRGFSIS